MKLKRIIATLTLTAMLCTSAVVAQATDTASDTDTTYLDTVVSLGLMDLEEDGTFDSEATVSRGELAKIVTLLLNGGKDPTFGSGVVSMFSDTEGHWADGYISYCANLEIVSGLGDGTFAPDGDSSRTAVAKMLLCALGYNAEVEAFVGSSWELYCDVMATKVAMYTGLEPDAPSAPLTRDEVALLVYNTLQAQCITYEIPNGDGILWTVEQGTMMELYFSE